ncbi:MAG: BREX system ATP-binding domain-containing protein, partial [Gemmatimonadales bacterium]
MRLHGRVREVDALAERVGLAATGRGQVVFVEGEAGIGKSRLVSEAVAAAKDRGFAVFQARCEELERHRPFGTLADALGCQRRAADPARAAIGRLLVADAGEAAAGLGLRFRAVEEFVELVEQLALAQPAMVVLEDLHWAD